MQNRIKVQKTAINAVINVDFFRIILYNKVAKKILNSIKRINFTKALSLNWYILLLFSLIL
ncbi:hypothetical protein DXA10_05325 [Firmicutes bacterium AM55-24TS]|nr:hypothetical protein DXA10_05325 [Firmicutes bacterium AM55-24TS]